jgi:hypothetical protein
MQQKMRLLQWMHVVLVRLFFIPSIFYCSISFCSFASANFVVTVRVPEILGDSREEYNVALIRLALEKTTPEYGSYELQMMPPMNGLRSLTEVSRGKYTNALIELNYEPRHISHHGLTYVDFPIDLGVLGTRICFVSHQRKAELAALTNVEQLKQYTIGQGAGWADALILRHNQFSVIEITNYSSLFKMLAAGRMDLVCRGANEIKREYQQFGAFLALSLDEHFAIEYPLPRFFFTNATNTLLKERMEKGLQLAYADGSLVELWKEYYADSVAFIKLHQRIIFRLQNPLVESLSPGYERYSYKFIVQ